ncbi:hypothetical protein [Streptomyces sp. NPDC002785]|uniref:hypothetical protein n=1 Tax=Streptomyces sp. NPDC002785 TaxID=3154543 RepID=UPI00332D64C3
MQWVGLGFVCLGIALVVALVTRRSVPALARLYLPASVIAGFLIFLLGPQVLGLTGWSLVPAQAVDVM